MVLILGPRGGGAQTSIIVTAGTLERVRRMRRFSDDACEKVLVRDILRVGAPRVWSFGVRRLRTLNFAIGEADRKKI